MTSYFDNKEGAVRELHALAADALNDVECCANSSAEDDIAGAGFHKLLTAWNEASPRARGHLLRHIRPVVWATDIITKLIKWLPTADEVGDGDAFVRDRNEAENGLTELSRALSGGRVNA